MKQIGAISLSRLNNGAHFTFVRFVLKAADGCEIVKEKAGALVAALHEALDKEDEALKLSQKSLLSDKLAQADAERDALYIGFKKAVEGYISLPIADMAQAAQELEKHIRDYRIDTGGQMYKEGGMLANFIKDLENKYKAQVETLSLTPFVVSMKAANDRAESLMLRRDQELLGKQVGALKAARAGTDKAYQAFVQMVNSMACVFGDGEYAEFIDFINIQITQFKRKSIGQKADTPDTNPGSQTGGEGGSGENPGTGSGDTGGNTGGGNDDDRTDFD